VYDGGLGFGYKWDMGWMHDTLKYLERDPIHRKYHHNEITFRSIYAFSENFVMPLSHDEVVHGKGSLLQKMPGDDWQKFANLRLLLGYMYAQPGKKLLFMGAEFGQRSEWNHDDMLDWHLLQFTTHSGVQNWVTDLNRVYRAEPALHVHDCRPEGFQWIEGGDVEQSILSYLRRGQDPADDLLVICNFTPAPRYNYRVGVPRRGFWRELLNSDAKYYGGSGQGNIGGAESTPIACHGQPVSLNLTVPPLGIVLLKKDRSG
jgi:1,4-alpha-glucan branching enzyme